MTDYRDEIPGWELLRDAHDRGGTTNIAEFDPVAAAADLALAEDLAADAGAWVAAELAREDRELLTLGVDVDALYRDLDRVAA